MASWVIQTELTACCAVVYLAGVTFSYLFFLRNESQDRMPPTSLFFSENDNGIITKYGGSV